MRNWIRKLRRSFTAGAYRWPPPRRGAGNQRRRYRPDFEQLEGRLMPATLTPAALADGFRLTPFATGFPSFEGVGPVGIAFPVGGGVLVTDYPGSARLFPTAADGQSAAAVPVTHNYDVNGAVGLAQLGNAFYMTQQHAAGGGVLQVNADGTPLRQVVSGLAQATGIVADPVNGHLFVSTSLYGSGVYDVDPAAQTATAFASVALDGLALTPDGQTLYGAVVSGPLAGHVVGYDTATKEQVTDLGLIASDPDGVALGSGALAGYLFVNTNSGTLVEVNLATKAQTVLVTDGSRGDFVTPAPDGSLLLTQTDEILRLTPPAGASPPVAFGASYGLAHDQALSEPAASGVLDHAFGAYGDPLTAALVAGPGHGTLVLNFDGSFVYTPAAGFYGTDSFAYQARDGAVTSNTATVTLTVTEQAPAAEAHAYDLTHDQPLTVAAAFGVLAGASDADGDALTASLVSGPAHGSLTLNPDGSFTYVPAAGYVGADAFTYAASDGLLSSAPATVFLSVLGGQGPVASDNEYGLSAGQNGTFPGLQESASDADGDALTVSVVSGPAHGGLTFNADGTFTYVPQPSYAGDDSFTWRASDGTASSNAAVVLLHVLDSGRVTPDHEYAVRAGTPLSVDGPGLLDCDGPGDQVGQDVGPLVPVLVSGPSHGTLAQFNADGSFVYVPAAGYAGIDTFTYRVADGVLPGNVATVTIHVDDAVPLAGDQTYDVAASGTLTAAAPGVLAAAYDPDGGSLTATLVNSPGHAASFSLNPDGSFAYTPAPGFVGQDTFSYQAGDGILASNVATVTINVANTILTAADTYSLPASGPLTVPASGGVLSNDFDPAGLPMKATLLRGPEDSSGVAHGVLVLKANGSFSYTPDPGYAGAVTFTYLAGDAANPGGTQGSAVIEPEAEAPTVTLQSVTFGGPAALTLLPDQSLGSKVVKEDFQKGAPQWKSGRQYQYDVSYTAGSTMQVRAALAVSDATPFKNKKVMVRGLVTSRAVSEGELQLAPLEIRAAPATLIGKTLKVDSQANRAFANGAGYYASLNILWQYSLDNGSSWTDVDGYSSTALDITQGKPRGSDLFDTVVSLGSHALADAAGLQPKPSDPDIIFGAFGTLDVQRFDDGTTLKYWAATQPGQPNPLVLQTLPQLLQYGTGSCYAWAQFFAAALAAQGIALPAAPLVEFKAVTQETMLVGVNQWSFAGNGQKLLAAPNQYVNQNPLVPTIPQTKAVPGNPTEVTYVPNVGTANVAQGNPNPMAVFPNHTVVRIGNEIFDPSYGLSFNGTSFADAMQQLQTKEIAAFQSPAPVTIWRHVGRNGAVLSATKLAPTDTPAFRAFLITKKTLAQQQILFNYYSYTNHLGFVP
jgi:hypothetical protein